MSQNKTITAKRRCSTWQGRQGAAAEETQISPPPYSLPSKEFVDFEFKRYFGYLFPCSSQLLLYLNVSLGLTAWTVILFYLIFTSSPQLFINTGGRIQASGRCQTVPWTVARQAPLSMGFSRPEYWSGLPCPPPGDLPDPGIELVSPVLQADCFPSGKGLSAWGLLPPAAPAPHSCSLSFLQTIAS